MFSNRTAWFSNSVRKGIRHFWVSEGGSIASWMSADYLFSEDATCSDTQMVFESRDYIENNVTVFHSCYLSACKNRHCVKSVCIGHYVLPPAPVQDEVRAVVGRFIWEQEDQPQGSQPDKRTLVKDQKDVDRCCEPEIKKSCHGISPENTPLMDLCCEVQHYPVNNMVTGYVSIAELKKYPGELRDFIPGHLGSSVSKVHSNRHGPQPEML